MNSCTVFLIRIYQKWISICFSKTCRFYPSCSNYALDALKKYCFIKAVFLVLRRLLKCHRFNSGGVDFVN